MPKECCLYYLYISGDAAPFYVGKTSPSRLSKRVKEHIQESKSKNTLKCNLIKKALREGAEILARIVLIGETEFCYNTEIDLIARWGRRDNNSGPLCNHSTGGEGNRGAIISPQQRARISQVNKGNRYNAGRKRPDMLTRFSKPVTVYDSFGGVIGAYPSGAAIESEMGIPRSVVSQVALLKRVSAKGPDGKIYQFRFSENAEPIPSVSFCSKPSLRKPIERLGALGQVVEWYPSVSVAEKETGIRGLRSKLKRARMGWRLSNNNAHDKTMSPTKGCGS